MSLLSLFVTWKRRFLVRSSKGLSLLPSMPLFRNKVGKLWSHQMTHFMLYETCSILLFITFFPAGCWQQEYLQFQFGGAPVSQKALTRSPCCDPQYAALASGIIKVSS
jgi:hypothetical protein